MTFRANALMGGTTVEKTVKVRVRGHEAPAALTFRAHVPDTIRISPSRLEWSGGDLAWREITLESPLDFELLQIRASSTGYQWETSAPPGESERKIVLKVRPLGADPRTSLLTIETSLPDPWNKTSVPLMIAPRGKR